MAQIAYTKHETLLTRQKRAEKAMLEEFAAGSYTMEKPLIKVNPYELNALAAVVLFETEEETAITLRVVGKTPQADLYHTFPRAKKHVIPVVGLYPKYTNTIELWKYQKMETKVAHTIEIGEVEGTDLVESMKTTPEYLQDNMIFLCPAIADLAIAVDYAGDVRLKFTEAMVWDIHPMANGHFLMGSERLVRMPYFVSGLYEFDMVGKIYKEYKVPRGYHHDQILLPNGDLLALSCNWPNGTVEDQVVVIDKESGEVKKTFNIEDMVKPGSSKSGSWSDEDWFHCNAVWYDENTNSITLSGRHMNAMINADFETGKLNWIVSDPSGWAPGYEDYLFQPVNEKGEPIEDDSRTTGGEEQFGWQYEQHANLITPHGDVLCFDNHHYGSPRPDEFLDAAHNYSRGVQYRIDTDKMTIQQVWQYGKERGPEFFSPYISNVIYYNEGSYLIHSGGIAFNADGTPSDQLGPYAQVDDPNAKMESVTVEETNGKVELELHVASNYYRGRKVKLYSEGNRNDLELGEPVSLGEIGQVTTMDMDIPAEETGELLPEKTKAAITEDDDLVMFEARFEKGQLVLLVLQNEEETRRYFISTSKGRRGAMCTGTFLPDDDRITRTVVTKDGLKGKYNVRCIIDDKMYETGVTIEV